MRKNNKLKMYNEDIKEKYLQGIENEEVRELTRYTFAKTYESEEIYKKDLFEMSLNELENAMYGIAPSTSTSSYNSAIRIRNYIEWSSDNGLRRTNIIPLDAIDLFDWSKQFVSTYKNRMYTREEILEMCDELYNYADKALLLALFEGISGTKHSELINLKMSDVSMTPEGFEASLMNEDGSKRTISISETLFSYLRIANGDKEYFPRNGNTHPDETIGSMEYLESPYIFKKIRRGKAYDDVKLDSNFVARKIILFKNFFDSKYLNASRIAVSGMMHMMNELREADGGFKRDHVYIVAEHYDMPKYGSGSTHIRNYTAALRRVDNSEFNRLYGYSVTE